MKLKAEEKNNSLTQEVQSAQHQRIIEELERENNSLKEPWGGWRERLQALAVVWKKSNPRPAMTSRYGGVGCDAFTPSHSGLCSGIHLLAALPDAKSIEV